MIKETRTFSITRIKREAYFNMKETHFHSIYEIYYLLSGTRNLFINDTIYMIKAGDLALINKYAIHRSTYKDNNEHIRIAMMFSDEYVEMLIDAMGKEAFEQMFQKPVITIPVSSQPFFEELFSDIEQEYSNKNKYYEIMIKNYIQKLLVFLLRLKEFDTITDINKLNLKDELMQRSAKFISANFKKNLTLQMAADYVFMNPTYFSKKFKKATGFGFHDYLLKLRLREAMLLLQDKSLKITEIAAECGFNDSNYFGDVFKKAIGVSPSQYRKRELYLK